ncbi:hypothetical protein TTHERM_01284780 (macronuclear) [Tetrahymena thermophila SB210]|uniref:Uncharacterized protein n=1 Tax=Tetrahymena thermophila (strain SB210) TaxID=312017 RepID=Q24HR7_TETTS|nr:hypothetical protein TTHERM_01284780 [Tetrahymena thermophila SB210]EAS07328.2 hypothetical protein TTHERM_01284780 [Tetrahymena thermophila SB210]|eukprot:XP_001027570.2 hypothetical protein TTHERM_01284780 [Tetrahymena thermophila SB210]
MYLDEFRDQAVQDQQEKQRIEQLDNGFYAPDLEKLNLDLDQENYVTGEPEQMYVQNIVNFHCDETREIIQYFYDNFQEDIKQQNANAFQLSYRNLIENMFTIEKVQVGNDTSQCVQKGKSPYVELSFKMYKPHNVKPNTNIEIEFVLFKVLNIITVNDQMKNNLNNMKQPGNKIENYFKNETYKIFATKQVFGNNQRVFYFKNQMKELKQTTQFENGILQTDIFQLFVELCQARKENDNLKKEIIEQIMIDTQQLIQDKQNINLSFLNQINNSQFDSQQHILVDFIINLIPQIKQLQQIFDEKNLDVKFSTKVDNQQIKDRIEKYRNETEFEKDNNKIQNDEFYLQIQNYKRELENNSDQLMKDYSNKILLNQTPYIEGFCFEYIANYGWKDKSRQKNVLLEIFYYLVTDATKDFSSFFLEVGQDKQQQLDDYYYDNQLEKQDNNLDNQFKNIANYGNDLYKMTEIIEKLLQKIQSENKQKTNNYKYGINCRLMNFAEKYDDGLIQKQEYDDFMQMKYDLYQSLRKTLFIGDEIDSQSLASQSNNKLTMTGQQDVLMDRKNYEQFVGDCFDFITQKTIMKDEKGEFFYQMQQSIQDLQFIKDYGPHCNEYAQRCNEEKNKYMARPFIDFKIPACGNTEEQLKKYGFQVNENILRAILNTDVFYQNAKLPLKGMNINTVDLMYIHGLFMSFTGSPMMGNFTFLFEFIKFYNMESQQSIQDQNEIVYPELNYRTYEYNLLMRSYKMLLDYYPFSQELQKYIYDQTFQKQSEEQDDLKDSKTDKTSGKNYGAHNIYVDITYKVEDILDLIEKIQLNLNKLFGNDQVLDDFVAQFDINKNTHTMLADPFGHRVGIVYKQEKIIIATEQMLNQCYGKNEIPEFKKIQTPKQFVSQLGEFIYTRAYQKLKEYGIKSSSAKKDGQVDICTISDQVKEEVKLIYEKYKKPILIYISASDKVGIDFADQEGRARKYIEDPVYMRNILSSSLKNWIQQQEFKDIIVMISLKIILL